MKSTYLSFLIFSIFLLNGFTISAQVLTPLETEFINHQMLLSSKQFKLDSLNKELIQSASKIDLEKSKISPDENKLSSMMSSALTLSKKIETLQKSVETEEEKNEHLRWQLDRQFHIILDSLQSAEQTAKTEPNRQRIIKQIGLVTEKILFISPPIPSLSFDPKDIMKMTVQNNANSIEKELFKDYLTNAVREISEHIEYLQNVREEIEEISKLQDKASRFMKDVQSDDKLSIFGQIQKLTASSSNGRSGTSSGFVQMNEGSARSSFNTLLRQLDINPKTDLNISDYTEFNSRNRDFIKLIKEAEIRLAHFKQIISNKLVAENAN